MLVLTRKSDESIMIGNDVEVRVLKVSGNQVHLGIVAPRNVSVYRHEIYEKVLEENRNALQSTSSAVSRGKLEKHLSTFQRLIGRQRGNQQAAAVDGRPPTAD